MCLVVGGVGNGGVVVGGAVGVVVGVVVVFSFVAADVQLLSSTLLYLLLNFIF